MPTHNNITGLGMAEAPEFRDLTPWEENGRHLEAVRDGKGWSLYLDPGDGGLLEKIATFEDEEAVDRLAHYFRSRPDIDSQESEQ